jgi:hypothetical protein
MMNLIENIFDKIGVFIYENMNFIGKDEISKSQAIGILFVSLFFSITILYLILIKSWYWTLFLYISAVYHIMLNMIDDFSFRERNIQIFVNLNTVYSYCILGFGYITVLTAMGFTALFILAFIITIIIIFTKFISIHTIMMIVLPAILTLGILLLFNRNIDKNIKNDDSSNTTETKE